MAIIKKIRQSLERPTRERKFGTGWLSGAGAVLSGAVGLALVLVLRYPSWLTTPELNFIHESGLLQPATHLILMWGYVCAILALLLSKDKTLGFVGLALVMAAALIGTMPGEVSEGGGGSIYFGLDFFILNVLIIGFLFIPLERLSPRYRQQPVFRREWQEDMFYYMVSSLLVQVLTFLSTAPANFISSSFDLTTVRDYIGGQPLVLQIVLIMLFTDFVQYWLHRAFHTFPFLWRFHAVHHSAKSMDWLAGARMHILEIALLRGLTAVPMLTLGFDPVAVQAYLLVVYFYSSFVHANIGWNLGFVERFFVTPRFHHWHHGNERAAIDINYAVHFPIFDFLFGTHHMPKDKSWPLAYGVVGDEVPRGYWKQFLYPFKRPKPLDDADTKVPDAAE
ncbi:sterol desaturase family protein [Pseudahrensia aquimaris]|uniref:Sterol desaturase family protein n=1 Tax=Pseudahrensia aquimaris TaxID=744461 RepID=A0ABW3FEH8_9HYPH